MFDEQNTSKGSPPSNLPFQPDDMLAGVEDDVQASASSPASPPDALSAGLLKPKTNSGSPSTPPVVSAPPLSYATKPPILGKILGVVIGVAVLGGIGVGGWWVYTYIIKKTPEPAMPTVQNTPTFPTTSTPTTQPDLPSRTPATSTPVLTGDTTDTDRDGLTDEEERLYGSSVTLSDTDSDGLSDFDEIKVWNTDPNNPDSDSDSYKDGDEVKNGYNPKGAGKLFNIPSSTTPATVTPSGPSTAPSSTPAPSSSSPTTPRL